MKRNLGLGKGGEGRGGGGGAARAFLWVGNPPPAAPPPPPLPHFPHGAPGAAPGPGPGPARRWDGTRRGHARLVLHAIGGERRGRGLHGAAGRGAAPIGRLLPKPRLRLQAPPTRPLPQLPRGRLGPVGAVGRLLGDVRGGDAAAGTEPPPRRGTARGRLRVAAAGLRHRLLPRPGRVEPLGALGSLLGHLRGGVPAAPPELLQPRPPVRRLLRARGRRGKPRVPRDTRDVSRAGRVGPVGAVGALPELLPGVGPGPEPPPLLRLPGAIAGPARGAVPRQRHREPALPGAAAVPRGRRVGGVVGGHALRGHLRPGRGRAAPRLRRPLPKIRGQGLRGAREPQGGLRAPGPLPSPGALGSLEPLERLRAAVGRHPLPRRRGAAAAHAGLRGARRGAPPLPHGAGRRHRAARVLQRAGLRPARELVGLEPLGALHPPLWGQPHTEPQPRVPARAAAVPPHRAHRGLPRPLPGLVLGGGAAALRPPAGTAPPAGGDAELQQRPALPPPGRGRRPAVTSWDPPGTPNPPGFTPKPPRPLPPIKPQHGNGCGAWGGRGGEGTPRGEGGAR